MSIRLFPTSLRFRLLNVTHHRPSDDVLETGLRSNIFLATKFGFDMSSDFHDIAIRNDAEYIKQHLHTSLEHLQTDYIDLYYIHRTDGRIPIEETMEVLKGYVK